MTKFFMVYRDGNYPPVKKHDTFKEAKEEMYRLCNKHPGENFYVLQSVSMAYGNVEIKGFDFI